jgi:Tol biopolymer transport system component
VSFLTLFLAFFISLLTTPHVPSPITGLLLTSDGTQESIILIHLESGDLTRISVTDGLHTAWGFSPDGCRVLLTVMSGDGLARAYTSRLDGSDLRELVIYDELPRAQWGIWEPTWSPVGDKIAFKLIRDGFENRPERAYHIAWVSPDGGEPTFYSVTGNEHTPVWSADGSRLAYVSYSKRAAGERFDATAEPDIATTTPPENLINEADLWVVGSDGTNKFRATAFEIGSVRAPRWSPNDEWVSFVMSPSASNDTLWVIRPVNGAKPVQVTYRYNLTLDHTWLPDSSALLVSARSVNSSPTAALWTFPPKAGADDSAALYTLTTDIPYPDYPVFSPDGTQLTFRTGYRIGVLQNTGYVTILTEVNGNMPIYWSPNPLITSEDCVD